MKRLQQQQETIKKCERILNLFDDLLPRPYCVQPKRKSSDSDGGSIRDSVVSFKPRKKSPKATTTMFFGGNRLKKPSRQQSTSLISKSSHLSKQSKQSKQSKHPRQPKDSFVSPYNRESRLERIMKLKISPQINRMNQLNDRSSRYRLDTSFSSVTTSRNKENRPLSNKPSRLERIMQLKVAKPAVDSTLNNYKPFHAERPTPSKKASFSSVVQLRECKRLQEKQNRQQDREERLWKNFERERQQTYKEQSKSRQKEYVQGRRMEKKIESMVVREVERLAAERQKELRKKKVFSDYLFQ